MAEDFSRQYPHLFSEVNWPWGPTKVRFTLLETAPPDDLISNVNIVPYIGDQWVIIRLSDGIWEIPGGTLEPGEIYPQAIQRELLEEAGARLVSMQLVGAWDCLSLAEQPYRPHLPHPHYYRLLVCAEVSLVSPPTNPPGAEQVDLVEAVPLEEAASRFISQNRHDLAEAYQLASSLWNR